MRLKDVILHEEDLVHPLISYALYLIFSLSVSILSEFIFNLETEIHNMGICSFVLSGLLFSLFKIRRRVSISDGVIKKGIYTDFIGYFSKKECLKISRIKNLEINQNKDKFFNIEVFSNQGTKMIIRSIPNRIPAESELEKIRKTINSNRY
ncbi:hypothetical protein [Seonamhaeicola sp. ML3]|uniref:hypothetical protein n=1 Tax=Seonamhaeicola sp. ML3 TaxID=2937786 RepID=UPI00200EA61B|nr:hypothetical protein [Seonamhaeicola sp. ML3]